MDTMLAMVPDLAARRLRAVRRPLPTPGAGEVLLRVRACGVCPTDVRILDRVIGTSRPHVISGREVVGEVVGRGPGAARFALGARVGVPRLGHACRACRYPGAGRQALADEPASTDAEREDGYAEFVVARERSCFAMPAAYDDLHAAPLVCAGLSGFCSWRAAGGADPSRIGIWGFGPAAQVACQLAVGAGQDVYVVTCMGDTASQDLARQLGAVWAGGSDEAPPAILDAALILASAGDVFPRPLSAVRKGGVLACAGIHVTEVPDFPHARLEEEREVRAVNSPTPEDVEQFFALLQSTPVRPVVQQFRLLDANAAFDALRHRQVRGSAVLMP